MILPEEDMASRRARAFAHCVELSPERVDELIRKVRAAIMADSRAVFGLTSMTGAFEVYGWELLEVLAVVKERIRANGVWVNSFYEAGREIHSFPSHDRPAGMRALNIVGSTFLTRRRKAER